MIPEGFKHALSVEDFDYYLNEEEPDCDAILFKSGELLSDNYFATNSLMEDLDKIYLGEITNYKMEPDMEDNYKEMIKEGCFDWLKQ